MNYYMQKINESLKNWLLVLVCIIAQLASNAQKLPKTQTVSLRAPTTIKIDGMATEWNDKFMAYNNKVNLFYTISNDDDNIYLVIHSDNPLISSKIMQGGLTFTVNALNRKSNGGVSVTYPLIGEKEISMIYKTLPKGINDNLSTADKEAVMNQRDKEIGTINNKNINNLKEMRVTGIGKKGDTVLSLFNDKEVKVCVLFDAHQHCIYEMAVPLKYLNIQAENHSTIHYNIKIFAKHAPANFNLHPITVQDGGPPLGAGGIDIRTVMADTDFWGEYTLAKK